MKDKIYDIINYCSAGVLVWLIISWIDVVARHGIHSWNLIDLVARHLFQLCSRHQMMSAFLYSALSNEEFKCMSLAVICFMSRRRVCLFSQFVSSRTIFYSQPDLSNKVSNEVSISLAGSLSICPDVSALPLYRVKVLPLHRIKVLTR